MQFPKSNRFFSGWRSTKIFMNIIYNFLSSLVNRQTNQLPVTENINSSMTL